jgi:hypothetical protein
VVVASNTDFTGNDATLAGLQRLAKDGVVRRYVVIERGGIRFGIFGLLGKEAQLYTDGAGAVKFSDAIEAAREKLVAVTKMVLAELSGHIAERLEQFGNRRVFLLQPERRRLVATPAVYVCHAPCSSTST